MITLEDGKAELTEGHCNVEIIYTVAEITVPTGLDIGACGRRPRP